MQKRILTIIGVVIWVIIAFAVASVGVSLIFVGINALGLRLGSVDDTIFQTVIAALTYICAIALTAGVPWLIGKHATDRRELGVWRLISWKDIRLTVPAVIVYVLIDALLLSVVSHINGFNPDQAQDIGFSHLVNKYEFFLAFLTLVIVAPLAEEVLFRGYLFSKIRKRAPFWVTMLLVSLTFASLHLLGANAQGEMQLQWNVAVDVFALSLVLCSLREVTKSIWSGVLLHALKNGLAFYLLFIVPLLHTMGA